MSWPQQRVQRPTRGFAGNVVRHACDAVNLVDDACRDLLEERKVKVVGLLDVLVPEPRRQYGMLILTSADMKSSVLTARRLGSVSSDVVMA